MSCCAPAAGCVDLDGFQQSRSVSEEIELASRDLGDGVRQTDLSVPGIHCGACIAAVEAALARLPGVSSARVNLSLKRVAIRWLHAPGPPPDMIGALRLAGYGAHLFSMEQEAAPASARLVKATAVAGFCAMNIMLLSVSVWFGADASTRQAFHLLSALLALPALLYSGRIFYLSAWTALRHGRTNMDVPISVGVSLAFALSLYDTAQNAPHAYFDGATSLLFFLLVGRTLDMAMREKARSAVLGLVRLAPNGATVLDADGHPSYVPVSEIEPGARVRVAAGDRVPVDGVVEDGRSSLDRSMVTGESEPRVVERGATVQAGLMNLTGPLTLRATARVEDSFLSEMVRMMAAAEGGRARYRRLADRAAALYSPVVHSVALMAFAGWFLATGDWHLSITITIAVLIVTCPCALGLAVPMVQVVAARRLFEQGIMIKDGSALERLAEVDVAVFDKTGTLTLGRQTLLNAASIDPAALRIARSIAGFSRHPAATAIAAAASGPGGTSTHDSAAFDMPMFDCIEEMPGLGLEAKSGGCLYRLGRPSWALDVGTPESGDAETSVSVLARDGELLAHFMLEDSVRPGARQALDDLARHGCNVEILSGDRLGPVQRLASTLGVAAFSACLLPAEKVARMAGFAKAGRKALMVGDGLNDAPALAAAYVSMAPATAADIGRNAADFVFLHQSLASVTQAFAVSRRAGRLIRQNFALAIGYNALAVPIAVLGYVTPLFAAGAMSLSSVIVVANAMRLSIGRGDALARRVRKVSA